MTAEPWTAEPWTAEAGSIKREIKAISRSVAGASVEQIAQVVATIDRMGERGAADAMVVPLRARLGALGLGRPLTLRRLSFEPLDPLIVPSTDWKRGTPLVPRAALMPLFDLIRAGIPDFTQLEAMLARAATDPMICRKMASTLWRAGAQALRQAPLPPRWRETSGLAEADFLSLRETVILMLEQADQLKFLASQADEPLIELQLREILAAAAQRGGLAWQAMLVRLCAERDLVALAMRLARECAITPELAQGLEPGFVCAQDQIQARMEALAENGGLSARQLSDIAEIVVDLEAAAGPRSDRKRAAEQLRREAGRHCTQAVERVLEADLLPALARCNAESPIAAQVAAEAAAREARSLGLIGQGLGVGDKYDAQLRPVIERLADPANPQDPVDRARLLEILGKSQAAWEVYKSKG